MEGGKDGRREDGKTRRRESPRGAREDLLSRSLFSRLIPMDWDLQRLVGSAHPTGTTNYRLGFVRSVKFKMPRHGLIEVFQSFVKS